VALTCVGCHREQGWGEGACAAQLGGPECQGRPLSTPLTDKQLGRAPAGAPRSGGASEVKRARGLVHLTLSAPARQALAALPKRSRSQAVDRLVCEAAEARSGPWAGVEAPPRGGEAGGAGNAPPSLTQADATRQGAEVAALRERIRAAQHAGVLDGAGRGSEGKPGETTAERLRRLAREGRRARQGGGEPT
jgi:hypothetical protein